MFEKNIKYKQFLLLKKNKKKTFIKKIFYKLIQKKSDLILSLSNEYKDSYPKEMLKKFDQYRNILLIGMGGSALGSKAIYSFLKSKKKITFIDNISNKNAINNNIKTLSLIVSKSGNTLETISNSNIFIKKNFKNIFLVEKKKNYLINLAKKLKADIVHHNKFIGGRFSVLSEVGMLPAQLMGFDPKKFRRLNNLINNKKFVNILIENVLNIYELIKKKKTNSIILNYDDKSDDFFYWYQQLTAESLGKNNKGIMPFLSAMPKDNHSLMQYYLDGIKNNFFTFFFVKEKKSPKIKKSGLLKKFSYLQNKTLNEISYAQCLRVGLWIINNLPLKQRFYFSIRH